MSVLTRSRRGKHVPPLTPSRVAVWPGRPAAVSLDDLPDPVAKVIDYSDVRNTEPEPQTPAAAPSVRPPFRGAYPGVAADALAEMRAEDVPVDPRAVRHSFDFGSWVPSSAGLRVVPLRTLDDTAAHLHATVRAGHDVLGDLATIAMDLEGTVGALTRHPELYPAHVLRMAFAPLIAMLDEVTL